MAVRYGFRYYVALITARNVVWQRLIAACKFDRARPAGENVGRGRKEKRERRAGGGIIGKDEAKEGSRRDRCDARDSRNVQTAATSRDARRGWMGVVIIVASYRAEYLHLAHATLREDGSVIAPAAGAEGGE